LKVEKLFENFLYSTKIEVKEKKRLSPVSTAKVMHLFAPNFFIPWDNSISKNYKYQNKSCYWRISKNASKKYIYFLSEVKNQILKLDKLLLPISKKYNKSILKIIDLYNLCKYTHRRWD